MLSPPFGKSLSTHRRTGEDYHRRSTVVGLIIIRSPRGASSLFPDHSSLTLLVLETSRVEIAALATSSFFPSLFSIKLWLYVQILWCALSSVQIRKYQPTTLFKWKTGSPLACRVRAAHEEDDVLFFSSIFLSFFLSSLRDFCIRREARGTWGWYVVSICRCMPPLLCSCNGRAMME